MNDQAPQIPATDHAEDRTEDHTDPRDRKAGLVFFGLLQIAIGGVLGLVALFEALVISLPNSGLDQLGAETMRGSVLFLVAFLVPLAGMFVWLGVGSILARRWSRALSLVVGWLWLALGVVSLLGMIFILPSFSEVVGAPSADSRLSQDQAAMIGTIMKTVMILFQSIVFVALPGAIVLFYRSRHVKATCDSRDPKMRWTDRCPLPVLALSVLLGFGAYQSVLGGLSPFRMFPAFGTLVRGTPAGILLVLFGLLLLYLAWAVFGSDVRAWWVTVGLYLLVLLSSVVTSLRIDPDEIARALQLPEAQWEALPPALLEGPTMLLSAVIGGAFWLGFLLFVKRYFPEGESSVPASGH